VFLHCPIIDEKCPFCGESGGRKYCGRGDRQSVKVPGEKKKRIIITTDLALIKECPKGGKK